MHEETSLYNRAQAPEDQQTCDLLAQEIDKALPEAQNKVWHAHPVWFLDGNPVVGYSKLKGGVRLLFWSGQSFASPGLNPEGKFKAAEARFASVHQVDKIALRGWLAECRETQWDYKNTVRRKGKRDTFSPTGPRRPASARRLTGTLGIRRHEVRTHRQTSTLLVALPGGG